MTGKLPKKIDLEGGDFHLVPSRTKVLNPSSSDKARYVCYLWPVRSDRDRNLKPQQIVSDESVPLFAWLTDDSQFTFGVRQQLPESLRAATALDQSLDGNLENRVELRYVMASDVYKSGTTGVCQTYQK